MARKSSLFLWHNITETSGTITPKYQIEIGDDVTLAPRVHILAHDASTKMHLNYTKIKHVIIGNKVFIGAGTIILPGVTVGNNVIIGAGSLVVSSIPDNSVFAGNPAKLICATDTYLDKVKKQVNSENTFGEEYTLRGNIDAVKMKKMKDIVEKQGVGFVI